VRPTFEGRDDDKGVMKASAELLRVVRLARVNLHADSYHLQGFLRGHGNSSPTNGQSQFLGYFGLQFLLYDKWEPEGHPVKTKRP
jgi:hypothetical protein